MQFYRIFSQSKDRAFLPSPTPPWCLWIMESSDGSNSESKQNHQLEKKRLNRAPSPARPFLKDVHSRASKPPAIAPKSPKLSGKQQPSTGLLASQSRLSRRNVSGAKDKPAPAKSVAKSIVTKKAAKVTQHGTREQKITSKQIESSPLVTKSKKGKISTLAHASFGLGSPVRVPTGSGLGRVSHTDSSSDLSDCLSEPLSDEQRQAHAASSDGESGTGSGSSDRDQVAVDNPLQGALPSAQGAYGSSSAMEPCAGPSDITKERLSGALLTEGQSGTSQLIERSKVDFKLGHFGTPGQYMTDGGKRAAEEDLLREIEDLRSENDYLKDEVDELRAEMEELRDSYLEEEAYQLQELRRELDRANKNCRILQYRLRKAEQKSLRMVQTGQVDGELLRNLEQDLKVAKDVSVRLHNELETVEDKRSRAEDENEVLRQKLIEAEISKEALHNELERAKESSLRRRGTFKERRSASQDDSADLRCQLQFAKEESVLMRKKMAKLGREKDELEQELQKYKSVYGDMDSPLPAGEFGGGGPHSTREAELKLRLKLVEEEANILGRKIVELEVENRGLRAENEDIRSQYEREFPGREPLSSLPTSPFGDGLESGAELRRHLQFVEEEADLLRRSIAEIEDHNKQLTSELNRFKFGPGPEDRGSARPSEAGEDLLQQELKAARLQINELSGKVMKLQYENRVLVSNVQRCDLAAHLAPRATSPRDSDTESDAGRREGEDDEAAARLLALQPKREGPVGGESDSEELFERTSGFGSGKPSDASEPGPAELARHRRENAEALTGVRRDAERLSRMVECLISDTDGLVCDSRPLLPVMGGEPAEEEPRLDGGSGEPRPEPPSLDAVNARMRAFRTELHVFMEKLEHLGEDLSPMPNLTESSSFLSGVTSTSRDSPIGTLGRDLITDFQSSLRDELEWRLGQEYAVEPRTQWGLLGRVQSRGAHGHSKCHRPEGVSAEVRDVHAHHARPEQERRTRQEEHEAPAGCALQEEDEKRSRGEPHAGVQEQAWAQERALLQQELRLLRHNMAAVYVKLRWLLLNWRQGRRAEAGDREAQAEPESLDNIPELGLLMDQMEGVAEREDRPGLQVATGDGPDQGHALQASDLLQQQHQKQAAENRRVLHALRTLLEEFRSELRDEEQRHYQLQQAYANEKAGWEVQWAELKCHIPQLDEGGPEAAAEDVGSGDLRGALLCEREEHRRLLAESHSASMDLRWRLRHSEKRWSRERAELVERFDRERQDWDRRIRELHRSTEKLQWELNTRQNEQPLSEVKDGAPRVFSPQGSPRAPRSPRGTPLAPPASRSYTDPEAAPDNRPAVRLKGTESLFLDALSLDPMSESEVPPPSRLESEKRFPCLNENLNEISERKDLVGYHDEELGGGSLLRAKSVCSMSEFQRLMDSSPFLPDRSTHGDGGRDEVTPPLSPDDLKYIEEYNSKGWGSPGSEAAATAGGPPGNPGEVWVEGGRRGDHVLEPFQPTAWFLTTSATLTTSTLSSPEHCQGLSPKGGAGPERYGVRVLHSPPQSSVTPTTPSSGPDDMVARWTCDLPTRHRDILESALRAPDRPIPSTVTFASSLELDLPGNLSDDMKEVAFSVRNAIRSGPADRQVKDTGCQTSGVTTRGTQTTQTISVGLQTEALRNLTSSPHRCLTPKGGSTPISSPSRNLRKMQYSPVVQSKFERPCCSPKYGSPKLQRKPTAGKVDQPNSRAATPTTPQKGYSESAWARSTTTRDSPVHTTINDGLSSLFNIIDHSPVIYDTLQKFTRSPSRSRPTEPSPVEPKSPGPGVVQEFLRNVRGRSPSPVQLIVEAQADRTPEVLSIRQDLSAPPGYTLAENAARLLNKRLLEEKRPPSGSQAGGKEGRPSDVDKPLLGPIEDLPCSAVAPPLDSCFLRPARPANRRPPSRWAVHSPSTSPRWSQAAKKMFRFPPAGEQPALLESEEHSST